jgi:TolB protein
MSAKNGFNSPTHPITHGTTHSRSITLAATLGVSVAMLVLASGAAAQVQANGTARIGKATTQSTGQNTPLHNTQNNTQTSSQTFTGETQFPIAPPGNQPSMTRVSTPGSSGGAFVSLNGFGNGAATPNSANAAGFSSVNLTPAGRRASTAGGMDSARQVSFAREGSDLDPTVSRDGKQIVFASTQHNDNSDLYVKGTSSRVVTRITADTGDDIMPSISPDGQRVAFASNRNGSWDIYVTGIDGGKAIQITDDPSDDLHPSWSPDGTRVVFSRFGETSERWELWVAPVANSGGTQFIGFGLFPEWNPVAGTGGNGADQIAFQLERERGARSFAIWTLDFADGQVGNPTEIASTTETALINPSWSPDGTNVVYTEIPIPGGNETGRPEWSRLWMVGVDGSGRVRLSDGPTLAMMPSWGADDKLYFVSNRGGTDNVWAIDMTRTVRAARMQPGEPLQYAGGKAGAAVKTASHGHDMHGDPAYANSHAAPSTKDKANIKTHAKATPENSEHTDEHTTEAEQDAESAKKTATGHETEEHGPNR